MDKESKTNINSSSLIDLKAELYRKHEEFKQQKINSGSTVKGRVHDKPKPELFARKNKGVLERAQKDFEEKIEEEDVLTRSRKALEAKSKLYEKMSTSSQIPDEDSVYLVDFQKKVIDNIVETRDRDRKVGRSEVKEEVEPLADVPPPSDPQEEWVDYTDSLGRSRRCMKKDLPQLIQQDKEMAKVRGESVSQVLTAPIVRETDDTPTLMSSDMHRELLRQKWEKEEEAALNSDNIHYSNVQFDEIRTHGVGFYQFDKSHEKRQEQMDALHKMREQTIDERSRKDRLKEKRKAMMDARLAKVKQRRKLKEGAKVQEDKDEDEEIGPKLEEMLSGRRDVKKTEAVKKEPEPLTRDDAWKKSAPEREWDKGKEKLGVFSQERWISERRAERENEFAPPSMYFDSQHKTTSRKPQPSPFDKYVEKSSTKVKPTPERTSQFAPPSSYFDPQEKKTHNPPLSTEDKNVINSMEIKPMAEDVASIPLPCDSKEDKSLTESGQNSTNELTHAQGGHFVSLPDMSVPPPGFQTVTKWPTNYVPPNYGQNYTASSVGYSQLPDTSVPPPAVNPHPGTFAGYSSVSQNVDGQQTGYENQSHVHNSVAYPSNPQQSVVKESTPTVFVPRAAVVDTRLVQNVDDNPTIEAPEVQAQAYRPGSFTAALQAESQAQEYVATASRDKAHFRGGPVLYSAMSTETTEQPESQSVGDNAAGTVTNKTENDVAAFLKDIRENT